MARKEENNLPKIKVSRDSLKKAVRIFQYIGAYKWQFFLGLIFLVLTGVTAIVFPRFMGQLVAFGQSMRNVSLTIVILGNVVHDRGYRCNIVLFRT